MRYYFYDVWIPDNDEKAERDLEKYVTENGAKFTMDGKSIHHKERHQKMFAVKVPEINNIQDFRRVMMGVNSQIECYMERDGFLHKIGHYQGEEH